MKQKCFASFPTAHGSVANGRAYGQNDVQAFSGDLTRPEQHQEICSVDTTRPCGFVEQPPARHAQNPQLGSFSENRVSGFGPVVSLAFTLERKNVLTAKARSTTGVKVDFHRRKDLKKKKRKSRRRSAPNQFGGCRLGQGNAAAAAGAAAALSKTKEPSLVADDQPSTRDRTSPKLLPYRTRSPRGPGLFSSKRNDPLWAHRTIQPRPRRRLSSAGATG